MKRTKIQKKIMKNNLLTVAELSGTLRKNLER